jgi:PEP-CTERM motif
MRRLPYLLLLVMFVSISATCVKASTDCERWFAAYRQELAHNRQVQRIAAAKRRAKLYAQRKLSGYVPKPKPKTVVKPGPRMTRKQTLHHFDLACGALPEDGPDAPVIAEEEPLPPFDSWAHDDHLNLDPADFGGMIAENDYPAFGGDGPPPDSPQGGYPNYGPPVGGGGAPSGGGPPVGTTSLPPDNPPPPPPAQTPAVPEPSSIVLMLTGVAGAAGVVRRRFKA